MVLEKIFIKDYKNIDDEHVRTKYGILAGIVGIISNIILVIIKVLFGILSASISLIADAMNNLSDAASSILTVFGFKISSKPPDSNHPFGHERIEYIISLIIAIIILIIGGNFLLESIRFAYKNHEVDFSIITIIILVIAILIKIFQAFYYYSVSKKIKSQVLKAAFRDSLSDVLVTTTILVSTIVYVCSNVNIDSYIGILVSLFILYNGIKTIIESSNLLIGELPNKQLVNEIITTLTSNDKIEGFHDLVFHMYGQNKIYATVHLEFDYKEDIIEIHEIIDGIEKEIYEKYKVEVVIHMDPVILDDEELNNYKRVVKNLLNELHPEVSTHDFRLVKGKDIKRLFFDCAVDADYVNKKYNLKEDIERRVCDTIKGIECHVTIDIKIQYNNN